MTSSRRRLSDPGRCWLLPDPPARTRRHIQPTDTPAHHPPEASPSNRRPSVAPTPQVRNTLHALRSAEDVRTAETPADTEDSGRSTIRPKRRAGHLRTSSDKSLLRPTFAMAGRWRWRRMLGCADRRPRAVPSRAGSARWWLAWSGRGSPGPSARRPGARRAIRRHGGGCGSGAPSAPRPRRSA